MIINRFKIFHFGNTVKEQEWSIYVNLVDKVITRPSYYAEFLSSLSEFKSVLTPDLLECLRNGRIHLILSNSHEAFHKVVWEVYKVITELGIPATNVTLVTESADIMNEIRVVAEHYQKPEIQALWCRVFEYSTNQVLEHKGYDGSIIEGKILLDKPYEKSYVYFNRRWRLHRPILVALLHSFNVLDKGFVSLAESDDKRNWTNIWHDIEYMTKSFSLVSNVLNANKEKIQSLPQMYLDIPDLNLNPAELLHSTDYYYENSYFSVVSETNFYTDTQPGRFLSEKTFKPIAFGHPFIMVSVPRTLELLRDLGYKTFHPWIDESYDLDTDNNFRLWKIAREIKRLSSLDEKQISDFVNNVRPICEYNRELLKSKKDFSEILN